MTYAQTNEQQKKLPQVGMGAGGAAVGQMAGNTGAQQTQAVGDTDPFASMGGGVKLAGGQWVPKGHAAANSTQAVQTGAGGQQQTVAGAFNNALLNKLQPGALNAQNPQISGAIQANRVAGQRQFERDRALAAERAASQGLDQNAMNTQLAGLSQARGQNEAAFEGNAVMQLGQQQQNQLMQAIQIAANQGNVEQENALRRELAQLQATLGREELGLRGELGRGQLNLGLAGLLQGGQQFNQQLGANLGMFGAQLNQEALLRALGML